MEIRVGGFPQAFDGLLLRVGDLENVCHTNNLSTCVGVRCAVLSPNLLACISNFLITKPVALVFCVRNLGVK
jgi:hypothetical protein